MTCYHIDGDYARLYFTHDELIWSDDEKYREIVAVLRQHDCKKIFLFTRPGDREYERLLLRIGEVKFSLIRPKFDAGYYLRCFDEEGMKFLESLFQPEG